jgi:hypothetical protein
LSSRRASAGHSESYRRVYRRYKHDKEYCCAGHRRCNGAAQAQLFLAFVDQDTCKPGFKKFGPTQFSKLFLLYFVGADDTIDMCNIQQQPHDRRVKKALTF